MVPEKQENALCLSLCEFTFLSWWSITRFAMKTINFFAPHKTSSVSVLCNLLIASGNGPWFGRIVAETGEFVPFSLLWHPGSHLSGPAHEAKRDFHEDRLVPCLQLPTMLCRSEPESALPGSCWRFFIRILFFFLNKRYLSILSLPQKLFENHTSFSYWLPKKKERILSKMKQFWMKGVWS